MMKREIKSIDYYMYENKGGGRMLTPPGAEVSVQYPRQHVAAARKNADRILHHDGMVHDLINTYNYGKLFCKLPCS